MYLIYLGLLKVDQKPHIHQNLAGASWIYNSKINVSSSPAPAVDWVMQRRSSWPMKAAGWPSTAATRAKVPQPRKDHHCEKPVPRLSVWRAMSADPDVPEQLVGETVRTFGGLDILITNAGGPPSGAFESFDELAWQKAINQNLMNHVRLIKAALPYLRQSKAASVLTVTSYSVKQPIPNLVLSNSIRAATVGLTKSLALELGKDGIRFNSILPAWTETERVT